MKTFLLNQKALLSLFLTLLLTKITLVLLLTEKNMALDRQPWYEHYSNQVSMASNEELKKELGYLKSFDENDVEFILIEKEVKTKVQIVLNEMQKRQTQAS